MQTMKTILKKTLLLIGVSTLLFAATPILAHAAPADDACAGIRAAGGTCNTTGAAGDTLQPVIRRVINILSVVVGAVSVIMVIIGGFRYVVSNGDSNAVSGAKNTILYAIIGLLVVIFAQVIVSFVYTTATTPTPQPQGQQANP
jgi:hypothetical protein